jgi:hypothetical protein
LLGIYSPLENSPTKQFLEYLLKDNLKMIFVNLAWNYLELNSGDFQMGQIEIHFYMFATPPPSLPHVFQLTK